MVTRPIVSEIIERQMMNAVMMYQKKVIWRQWGLSKLRKQGTAILLIGPPGTGKTTIAEHLALKVRRKGIKEVSFADFGSHIPGENARQIRRIYREAKDNGEMTIFLDDCEAVLWNRSRAGSTAMWMLEVIDELLVQISKYPGLQILATNKPDLLDPALDRRVLATIKVGIPAELERLRLWKQKLPQDYPLKLTQEQLQELARDYVITGNDIENVIIEVSADALRTDNKPTFPMLRSACAMMHNHKIEVEEANQIVATLQPTMFEGVK